MSYSYLNPEVRPQGCPDTQIIGTGLVANTENCSGPAANKPCTEICPRMAYLKEAEKKRKPDMVGTAEALLVILRTTVELLDRGVLKTEDVDKLTK